MMNDGVDPRDLELPTGYMSGWAIENYARQYCEVNTRSSLAVIYGIAGVAACVAGQGGFVLRCDEPGGTYLEIPAIQHFMGIAPSGWRKSTALDAARRPLMRALATGVEHRAELVNRAWQDSKAAAQENGLNDGMTFDAKQFGKVFGAGFCPFTLVKDPTPEALRDFVIDMGGVAGVFSAEAELYRSMSYGQQNGSMPNLTLLLDLWAQEDISTTRVTKGHLHMSEAALMQAVLFQSDVFAEVTGGAGSSGDSFIQRGVFGRVHVVRAQETGGFEDAASVYADDNDYSQELSADQYVMTPLRAAVRDFEIGLTELVHDTDRYRAWKALHRMWGLQSNEYGFEFQVPEIKAVPRHEILLHSREARQAYRRVQRMQLKIEESLHGIGSDEDARIVFAPLASRFTQHVMREALVASLAQGYRDDITAEAIEDAATRLLPWRIAHTTDALLQRAAEITEDNLAESGFINTKGRDLKPEGMILNAIADMAVKNMAKNKEGFTRNDIYEGVRSRMGRNRRRGAGLGRMVKDALDALVMRSAETGLTALTDGSTERNGSLRVLYRLEPQYVPVYKSN